MWRTLLGVSAAVVGIAVGGAVGALLTRSADGLAGGATVFLGVLVGLVLLPIVALGGVRGAPPSRVRAVAMAAAGLASLALAWFVARLSGR